MFHTNTESQRQPLPLFGNGAGGENKPALNTHLISLLSVSIAFILHQALVGSFYQTNDDFVHEMILSGALPGTTPDAHLLTPNFLLSVILKALYPVMPRIPWYFALLLGMQYLSCFALHSRLSRRLGLISGIAAFWLYFISVQAYLLTSIQFTSTAVFTSCIGALLMAEACASKFFSKGELFMVLSLFTLSGLLRYQSCLLGLTMGFILICAVRAPVKQRLYGLAGLLAVLILCTGLQYSGDYFSCRNARWADFFATRTSMFKLVDAASIAPGGNSPVLSAGGWTENDGRLLQNFMYCDSELFSTEKIQKAAQAAPLLRTDAGLDLLLSEARAIACDRSCWAAVLLALWAFAFSGEPVRLNRRNFLFVTASVFTVMLAVMLIAKLPARIYFPCLAFLCAVTLLNSGRRQIETFFAELKALFRSNLKERAFSLHDFRLAAKFLLLVASLIFIAGLQYETVIKLSRKCRELERQTVTCLNCLRKEGGIYIIFGNAFPYEYLSPGRDLRALFKGVRIVPVFGYSNSPWFQSCLENLDLDKNALRALDSPGVFVISTDYLNSFYIKYAQEHLKKFVKLMQVQSYDAINVKIFSVRSGLLSEPSPEPN